MTRYIVTGFTARFCSGILSLTSEQAERRSHNLKPLGDGRYQIVQPVEFKSGEEFGFDGVVPKAMADEIVDIAIVQAEGRESETAPARPRGRPRKGASAQ